jgi:hypothetical protein
VIGCFGIERRLLAREAARLSKLAAKHAAGQAPANDYVGDERAFVARLRDFVVAQGSLLTALTREAVGVRDEYLLTRVASASTGPPRSRR